MPEPVSSRGRFFPLKVALPFAASAFGAGVSADVAGSAADVEVAVVDSAGAGGSI